MDCIKTALGGTVTTTSTFIWIDEMGMPQIAHDSTTGAIAFTSTTSLTFIGCNLIRQYRQEFLAANLVDVVMQHGIHRQALGIGTPVLGVIHQLMGSEVHILKPVEQSTVNDMSLNDIFNILGAHMDVGRIIRHNPDDRSLGTETKATRCHNINTTAQSILCNHPNKRVNDLQTA